MNNPLTSDIFTSFQDHLNSEQEIRDEIRTTIKEIEKAARNILTILQTIHQENGEQQTSSCCLKARQLFEEVRVGYGKLAKVVPKDEYYRFNDHWRFVTQRLAFLIALTVYLEVGILVSRDTVAEILGGINKWGKSVQEHYPVG